MALTSALNIASSIHIGDDGGLSVLATLIRLLGVPYC